MQAELLLRGATVYTQDRRQPRARSLAVGGGRILATGQQDHDLDDLQAPTTRVVELEGAAVVPGFVDAHVHFGHFALARRQVDLDAAPTLEAGVASVRAASDRLPSGAWVQGRGWDRNRWGRLPTRADLDMAVGVRPVALSSHDGHALWLNSAALAAGGITRETADAPGGVIERDATGEPSGVLFENAQDLVRDHIPEPSDAELREAIRQALRAAAAAGLTGIHNLEDARTRRVFQALEAAGDLTLRVYHGVPRGELAEARERGLRTGLGSDWVRIGPVKLFADGALGSRTAWLLAPYTGRESDDYRGVATLSVEELEQEMRAAADAGLDVAVHAIGDAAVRRVLDVFEHTRSAYPALRQRLLRIEHAQLVDPADVPRFRSLGVIASMQPIHATADWRTADTHWGARSRHAYAWRDLLQAGATLAFGTDAPVEHIEPLYSLYAAITRRDPSGEPGDGWYPSQRLALEEAVRAYTWGSSAAERSAGRRGSLSAGMDADLVALAPDPFERPAEALLSSRVMLTMVGGRITFEGE
ncbi:MAG TPA: amidohydrolase [Chloroflexota bacterium]